MPEKTTETKEGLNVKLDVNQLVEGLKSNLEKLANEKSTYEKERIEATGNLIEKCLNFVKEARAQEKEFEKELLEDIKKKQDKIGENYEAEIKRILDYIEDCKKDRDLLFNYAILKKDYKTTLDTDSKKVKIEEKSPSEKFWQGGFNIKMGIGTEIVTRP